MPKRKLEMGTGQGRGVEAKGLPRLRWRGRGGRCGEKVVGENLVLGSPPRSASCARSGRAQEPAACTPRMHLCTQTLFRGALLGHHVPSVPSCTRLPSCCP